jgi:HD-like signal output (HDOD) protein
MEALNDLLEGEISLPSPPNVAIKLLEVIKKEKLSLPELSDVISYEPAMAAKILKISNSAFYSLPYRVDAIDDAINVLGMDVLKNMTLSFALIKDMKKERTEGFNHEFFWRRSVTTAVAAELISFKLGDAYKEAFVAALESWKLKDFQAHQLLMWRNLFLIVIIRKLAAEFSNGGTFLKT